MALAGNNKDLVSRFWSEVYENRDYDRVGKFFAEDGVYEDVAIPDSAASRWSPSPTPSIAWLPKAIR